jgi:hypothetical protein
VASRLVALALVAPLCGVAACDSVVGIETDAKPCTLGAFTEEMPLQITAAEDFSIDWDMTFAVVAVNGRPQELDLATMTASDIDLGPYNDLGLALAPEGNALFYTAAIEPMVLEGALRGGATQWQQGATVPHGTFAGTPSADVFGPRRMVLKVRPTDTTVIELEDQSGVWTQIGDPHPLASVRAPNLTPNGLTMVWPGTGDDGMPAVFAAQRKTTANWFGTPTVLRSGMYYNAQLLDSCKRLYTTDGNMLEEYDR